MEVRGRESVSNTHLTMSSKSSSWRESSSSETYSSSEEARKGADGRAENGAEKIVIIKADSTDDSF